MSRVWQRFETPIGPHHHVFTSAVDPVKRLCKMRVTRKSAEVTSGVCDIKVMKTTQSGFDGYIRDKYTNLEPVAPGSKNPNRIMCTQMVAEWTYNSAPRSGYVAANEKILSTLLCTFAGPPTTGLYSKSLQETCYQMASEVLNKFPEVDEVYLETPNVHFYPYPLGQFGLTNPNTVFQSTDPQTTASGRIITRLSRKKPSSKL